MRVRRRAVGAQCRVGRTDLKEREVAQEGDIVANFFADGRRAVGAQGGSANGVVARIRSLKLVVQRLQEQSALGRANAPNSRTCEPSDLGRAPRVVPYRLLAQSRP